MTTTTQLGLTHYVAGQGSGHVTLNDWLNKIDAVIQLSVKDVLNTPAGTEVEGDRLLVGTSGSGAFSGYSNRIAIRLNSAWVFLTPKEGWTTYVDDDNVFMKYTGSAWVEVTSQEHSICILNPTNAEDATMFYVANATTIRKMVAVLNGSSTPSVTWTIRHHTDRSNAGNEVVTGGTTTTSTTTGSVVTSFNDATIPANSFVWLETTAKSGTVLELFVQIFACED